MDIRREKVFYDENGKRESLMVVLISMLVERPNLCACMKIRPIEFRHMAERCAYTLARLGRISYFAGNLCRKYRIGKHGKHGKVGG